MAKGVELGNVVQEMTIGNTRIRICDDYCRDKTQSDIDAILARIARNALAALNAAEAMPSENESTG